MNCTSAARSTGVEVTRLTRGYGYEEQFTPVLQDLSLRFEAASLTLVVGASGSGKSTLLASIGGLLRPQSGQVQVLGTSIWKLTPAALERFRFRHFGFVFQNFNLFPSLTAIEQVALPLEFAGVRTVDVQQRAAAALDEVGLQERKHLRPAKLSGGEKQRVAIARALVTEPAVLLADEPTSSLDSHNSGLVTALLRRLAKTHGATIITVTHDPRLLEHADCIVELRDGGVISARANAADPCPPTT